MPGAQKNHLAARRMEDRVITGNAVKVTFSSLSWPSRFSWMQRLAATLWQQTLSTSDRAHVLARCERDRV
jgi:hypothetical protein